MSLSSKDGHEEDSLRSRKGDICVGKELFYRRFERLEGPAQASTLFTIGGRLWEVSLTPLYSRLPLWLPP